MADKEYIERDKVLERSYSSGCATLDNPLVEIKSVVDYDDIVSIPAADVVEVRHGHWIKTGRPQKTPEGYYYWNTPLISVYVCSECGREESNKEPYCHCGAKMDGGTNE